MSRGDLPSGTVTFLFTDIEGSTKLLHELGPEEYSEALAEHRRVVRKALTHHGGVEVDTQGDAFFVAFPTVSGALAAATDAREGLASGSIRVRMGIHTGTPHLSDEGYVGEDVHKGARIAAAGHGGQVLLSKETRELSDVDVTDLGEHRVKDFGEPVWIFQLGKERFPPLKTISNTNLPRPASSFVGRQREIEEIVSLLRDGARLVTLTGPGGSGKTRLAIEAATELVPEFRNGVFWVNLAALRDHALVLETIAQTIGAKNGLVEHVGGRELLVLLDNFEQVIAAAPDLASLVETCSNLTALVTSRGTLRVRGEVEYPVSPLTDQEAVELFCARSRLAPDETIAELCRRLDNLPLAIVLAAARTSVLDPVQILARISYRLDLLEGGRDAEARQQTLRATIEWSYDLLDEDERLTFARIALFGGGCTFEAAEKVVDAKLGTLQSLVENNLLRHTEGRFWMLETIREYAAERLEESGEAELLRKKHAEQFLAFAEAANAPEQPRLYLALEAERANLRLAMEWFRDMGEAERELRLAAAMFHFWRVRGPIREARGCLDDALARATAPTPARVWALAARADLGFLQNEPEAGIAVGREAVALARRLGDVDAEEEALRTLANAASRIDPALARSCYEESAELSRRLGRLAPLCVTLTNAALVELMDGHVAKARTLLVESLGLARRIGNPQRVSHCLLTLTDVEISDRRFGRARDALAESLRFARDLGLANYQAWGLLAAALIAAAFGGTEPAARLLAAFDTQKELLGLAEDPFDQPRRVQGELDARAALGSDRFDVLYAEGQELTLDEAVALALGEVDTDS